MAVVIQSFDVPFGPFSSQCFATGNILNIIKPSMTAHEIFIHIGKSIEAAPLCFAFSCSDVTKKGRYSRPDLTYVKGVRQSAWRHLFLIVHYTQKV